MKKPAIILVLMVVAWRGEAALILDSLNTPQSISFDTTVVDVNNGPFTGTGFQPTPASGQLDSDSWAVTGWSDGALAFGGTRTTANTDYTRGTSSGGETTGGMYAFTVAPGNVALGFQPGGSDWNPGTLTLKVQNNTGTMLTSIAIAYVVYVRNDQDRANNFNFSHSADDTIYIANSGLDLISPQAKDASPAWVSYSRSATIAGLSMNDGGSYFLRWSGADVSGSGSRDEFALDDISITAVPEPAQWGLVCVVGLLGVVGLHHRHSRRRSAPAAG